MATPPIIDMRSFMGADLAGVFVYDFPDTFTYQNASYSGIFKDRKLEEFDEFGGPRLIAALEIHCLTASLATVTNGLYLTAKSEQKIIISSELSEDGNELIILCKSA